MKLRLQTTTHARRLEVTELRSETDWSLLRAGVQKLLKENKEPLALDFGTLASPPQGFTQKALELYSSALLQDTALFVVILCPEITPENGIFLTWEMLQDALGRGEAQQAFRSLSQAAQLRKLRADLDAPEMRTPQILELRSQVAKLKLTRRLLRHRLKNFAERAKNRPHLHLETRLAPSALLHQVLESVCRKEGLL
jgi:hypothetical protein